MSAPTATAPLLPDPPDFSLVLGGPLYQLWRRTRMAGDGLELLQRRIVVSALLAWGPLLVLSIAEGHAWSGSVALPFLYDIDTHVRLLLAVPLLIDYSVTSPTQARPAASFGRTMAPAGRRGGR